MSKSVRLRVPVSSAAAPVAVFVAVWGFRFLSVGAVENDHFVTLARAHQVLHGDWPVRDFFDPGMPLAYLLSAATAALFEPTMLTEVVTATTLLALAGALTYSLALRASGSVVIALAAVALEFAAAPRLYSAGKLLFPLGAVALAWRYADAPSTRRLVALAAWTALAGLWRHDLGIYIGVPAVVLLVLCHGRAHARRLVLIYAALCLAFLLPWLIYVQWATGLAAYVTSAVRFTIAEAQRTAIAPDPRQVAALLGLVAVPLGAIGLARRPDRRLALAHVSFAGGVALMACVFMFRDVLATRLPDVIGLMLVLAAWIAGRLIPKPALRTGALVALAVVIIVVVRSLASQGFGLPTPSAVVRRFAVVTDLLRTEAPAVVPNRERGALIHYLMTCTPETSRVLVSGFGPEIPVLARRPFAAGLPSWIPGYYTSQGDVGRARAQLSREQVSMAVMLEGSRPFVESWPELAAHLRARGFVEGTWTFGSGDSLVVWLPADSEGRRGSALPCAPG
jgi:hypothetical protein